MNVLMRKYIPVFFVPLIFYVQSNYSAFRLKRLGGLYGLAGLGGLGGKQLGPNKREVELVVTGT